MHILCRAQNMLQGAETTRLWITSQQLNEHMTERQKIKKPESHNSELKRVSFTSAQLVLVFHNTQFSEIHPLPFPFEQLSEKPKMFHYLSSGALLVTEFIQLALYANTHTHTHAQTGWLERTLPSFSWAMRLCFALMLASKVFRFSRSYSFTSAAARSRMSSGEGERLRVLLWGLLGSDIMLASSFPALYFWRVRQV